MNAAGARVAASCHYCHRTGQPLTPCCEHHPDVMVCADVGACRDFLLAEPGGTGQAGDDDGTEPYCTTCLAWVGMFRGLAGWRHFRGDPAPGGQRELYGAGHEAVIGWTVPPGRALSPGQVATIRGGLAGAADLLEHRAGQSCGECEASPTEVCEEHAADLDAAEQYRALAAQIGGTR